MRPSLLAVLLAVCAGLAPPPVHAQAPGGPPAVGVVRVQQQPVTETSEFVGRIQAIDRVNLIARVTAFLDQRRFAEGSRGETGRPALRAGAGAVPGRPRGQAGRGAARRRRRLQNAAITLSRALDAAAHAGRPAIRRGRRACRDAVGRRPGAGGAGAAETVGRSTWATPRSTRRSAARSAAPRSPWATSSRRVPARWPASSARTRCTWSFRSRCGPCWTSGTAPPARAGSARW